MEIQKSYFQLNCFYGERFLASTLPQNCSMVLNCNLTEGVGGLSLAHLCMPTEEGSILHRVGIYNKTKKNTTHETKQNNNKTT